MHAQAEAVLYDLLKAGVAERKACSINDILEPTCSENRVNFQYITRISIRCKSAFWTACSVSRCRPCVRWRIAR